MELKDGNSLRDKPHNDAENSQPLRNVQADHYTVSSAVSSDNVPVTEDSSEQNGLPQSPGVPEGSNHQNGSDSIVPTKADSAANTEHFEPILTTSENADKDEDISFNSAGKDSTNTENLCEAIVKISKPLCADYRSDSDTESLDSESDSSTSTDGTTDNSSENEEEDDDSHDSETAKSKTKKQRERKAQQDLTLSDLPPIEDLKITVPEDSCVEVGKISSIVDTLVVVESYKGTAALDIDTVLFLDCGNRSLGKVFDILGPITEPVYTVRFNSQDQIKSLNIEKDQKVYYAPKTKHTMFVFLSEVLKNKGSDASWKDNIEAPTEFQDFSDDEEERLHKNKQKEECDAENANSKESNRSRKRSFSRTKQTCGILQPSRFRHSGTPSQRRPNFPRNPPPNQFVPPPVFSRAHAPNSVHASPCPYNVPTYPGNSILTTAPHAYYPPRFSGPPFPAFGGLPFLSQNRPLHMPFFQQRSHAFPQGLGGAWGRPMFRPPPPPPPPAAQDVSEPSDGKP